MNPKRYGGAFFTGCGSFVLISLLPGLHSSSFKADGFGFLPLCATSVTSFARRKQPRFRRLSVYMFFIYIHELLLKFYPARQCQCRYFQAPRVYRSPDRSEFYRPPLKLPVCPCILFRTWGIRLLLSLFLSFQTFLSAPFVCVFKHINIKSEIVIPLNAGSDIAF